MFGVGTFGTGKTLEW